MDIDSIPGAQYFIYVFIYHFLFDKILTLCILQRRTTSCLTAFALYTLIKCFSKHKCFYSYSSIMDYAFTPYKMTYKMAVFVQKSIIFLGFYFDHIMTSVYFLFIVGWATFDGLFIFTCFVSLYFSVCFCKSPIVLSFGICCYNREI